MSPRAASSKPKAKKPSKQATKPAKKKPAKKAVTKAPKSVPAITQAPDKPLDWPSGLNSEKADALFAELERGTPKSKAPAVVGLAWRSVFRWMKQHKDFGERVEEAVLIGYQSVVDEIPAIADSAVDKDSAAAANCRIQGRKTYLQLTAPHRYAVKQLQLGAGTEGGKPGAGAYAAVGLVIVPMKVTGRGMGPTDPIEGMCTVVVPPKALNHSGEPSSNA